MVEGGSAAGRRHPRWRTRVAIGDQPVVVGRSADCDLVLADPTVSKRHIELRRRGTDVIVTDLGSTNGTTINGALVREAILADGDQVHVGAVILRYEAS